MEASEIHFSHQELRFIVVDIVGDERLDPQTNSVAVLTEKDGGNFTSVLVISSLEASVHNNTIVECNNLDDGTSSNFTIVMAG